MLTLWLTFLAAMGVTVVVLAALRPVARRLDFVDKPGGRKIHDEHVPVVGGLAMWVGFFIGSSLLPPEVRPSITVSILGFMFVLLGLLDDRFALSALLRLGVQILGAFVMVWLGGLAVHYVGAPFGPEPIIFESWVATLLCLLLVAGAMNAMNMVDGIDGLAGSLSLVGFGAVALVAFWSGDAAVLAIAVAVAGAVTAFLAFNLPLGFNRKIRTFMGDAGSMFIGFTLSWCLVALSQNPDTVVSPVTLLWFIAMPIYDMCSTAAGRLVQGLSPFHADTTHFHHALLRRGFKVPGVVIALAAFAVFWVAFGWSLEHVLGLPDWICLVAFLTAGVVTHVVVRVGDR
jgi:UDP-GlcNAc:undecaprenyl-phosphate GlcNAc-1-phosphate transferase